MKFKDLPVGNVFVYPDDGYTYVKTPHKKGYIAASPSHCENNGGTLLRVFKRELQAIPEVYEFPIDDTVIPFPQEKPSEA